METEKSNGEIGKVWTAYILGELFEAWPRRCDFNAMDIGVATGEEPRSDPEEFFNHLLDWLRDNGFVRLGESIDGAVYDVALTEKGCNVLGRTVPGTERTLGAKLKEVASGAGKDAGRAVVSSLISTLLKAGMEFIK